MRRYDSTAETSVIKSQAPARAAELGADLLVPLGQALVTGALLGGVGVFLLGELAPNFDGEPGKVWLALALGIAAIAWLLLLGQTRRLLWAVERTLGQDFDGDGAVGASPRPTLRVEVEQPRRLDIVELPGEPSALRVLARGVLGGRSLAEGAWSGRGGLFSRSEFRQLRDTLIERGLAEWRNPRAKAQGVALTASGRAVFRRLAELAD